MPVRQSDVIKRLKSGETLIHVLPKGGMETEEPFQYLSGGGQGNSRHLPKAETPASPDQSRPIRGCRAAGMAVG